MQQSFYARILKPALDRTAALCVLVGLAPVMALIALAVWRDSGRPVLFVQKRLGRGGREFEILKFRTMTPGAPPAFLPDGSTLVEKTDARVTRVGRFLRSTSLDELPQLINVLRGEMSLIGPRPDLVEQRMLYEGAEEDKLRVLPGITGLAAVSGRNELPWKERLRLDSSYARSVDWRLDGVILLRTFLVVLGRRGIDPAERKEAGVGEGA